MLRDTLRIRIDKDFSVLEFYTLLNSISELHSLLVDSESLKSAALIDLESPEILFIDSLPSLEQEEITASHRVVVLRVRYGSPGFIDLAGYAPIVGVFVWLVKHIIDLVVQAPDRALQRRSKRLENERYAIDTETRKQLLRRIQLSGLNADDLAERVVEHDGTQELIELVRLGKLVGSERYTGDTF